MDVLITQKKMTDSEAFVKARGGGNLIGKAMYGGGKITMKQLYLQVIYLECILDMQREEDGKWNY